MAAPYETPDIRQELEPLSYQVPLPPMTADPIQAKLREAYAAVEQYRHDIRTYAESLFNFYQNWANQYLRYCHGQVQDMQQANITLQGLQETLLSENAILHLELEQFKKHSEECQQGLSQPEKQTSSVDDAKQEEKASELAGPTKFQVKRRRRPTRSKPKERQPPPLLVDTVRLSEPHSPEPTEEQSETKICSGDHA